MQGEQALLRHAITPPKFEQGWLHREQLVDLLRAGIPKKFIAIGAPAGYGKTTLLADFSMHCDLPVCWIRLTEADHDLMRLAGVVAASLERAIPDLRGRLTRGLLSSSGPIEVARTFSAELAKSVESPVVLILDDVHLVHWPPHSERAFDIVMECFSEQVTIIACGRGMMQRIPFARLMAEGMLTILGPRELGLGRQEVIDLAMLRRGIELSDEDAQRILDITQGWVMGVVMMLESYPDKLNEIPMRQGLDAQDYLLTEAYEEQPEDVQAFMRESAILPVMTAKACDALLKRSGSESLLHRLVQRGLFISCSEDWPRTYEYHPQFRQVLLEALERRNPDRRNELRLLAAELLAESGLVEHALALHLEAGNVDLAAAIAEKNARAMLQMGRTQTLKNWIDKLQQHQIAIPMLHSAYAVASLRIGDPQAAAHSIERARSSITRRTPKVVQAYAECQRGTYHFFIGKFEIAEEAASKASTFIHARSPRWLKAVHLWLQGQCAIARSADYVRAEKAFSASAAHTDADQYPLLYMETLGGLIKAQMAQGKMQEASHTAAKGREILKGVSSGAARMSAKLTAGIIARHLGDLVDAIHQIEDVIHEAVKSGVLQSECAALIEKGMLLSDLGLLEESEQVLREGYRLAEKCGNAGCIRQGILYLLRNYSRQGDTGSAELLLDAAGATGMQGSSAEALAMECAALTLHSDPHASREQLRQVLKQSRLDAGVSMLCTVLLACAELKAGCKGEALSALNEAFMKAELGGRIHGLTAELHQCKSGLLQLARDEFAGTPTLLKVEEHLNSIQALAEELRATARVEMAPARELVVEALGKISIRLGGRTVTGPKPRALQVLCYLVDRGQESRDVLLEKFWPGHAPGKGVANLHADVYSLRRAIGKNAIILDGTTYRVGSDVAIRFDVAEFEAAARGVAHLLRSDPRRLSLLRKAIEYYGGSFLPGVQVDWVRARREKLETQFLDLLVDHAGEALLQDEPAEALKSLRRALAIDELREDTNALLMEALGRLGRKAELSVHYHRYVTRLREELGIECASIVRKAYNSWTEDFLRQPEGS